MDNSVNIETVEKHMSIDFERKRKELESILFTEKGRRLFEEFDVEITFDRNIPIWRHAFETMSESGKPTTKDTWILDEENGFLIKIPAGSNTARCLLLEELDKLPKEEGL